MHFDKMRDALERDAYGRGAKRERAQEALKYGTAFVERLRTVLADLRDLESPITVSEARQAWFTAKIVKLDELEKELTQEYGTEPD